MFELPIFFGVDYDKDREIEDEVYYCVESEEFKILATEWKTSERLV